MDEIHQAPYYGHRGHQKTIATAKKQYCWPGMKKDIAEYISRCMKCQQVKVEHQRPIGLLHPLPVLECVAAATVSPNFQILDPLVNS